MKKILSIVLILILSLSVLVSCGKNEDTDNDETTVNVQILSGTTGFGMAYLMEQNSNGNSKNKYEFSIEQTNASNIMTSLINGDTDIATLPTNAASTVYNKTEGKIEILAVNTLGVLYIVQKGNIISSLSDLEGKTIYCPAQNPAFILQYILDQNNINATVDTSYSQPQGLKEAVVTDKNVAVAVLPEPMVTIATSSNSDVTVAIDLTEEWNKTEAGNCLVQGCVVARKDFIDKHPEIIKKFMEEYKTSVEYLKTNVEDTAKLVVKNNIFTNENIAKKAIPNCNCEFIESETMKQMMNKYLEVLYNINKASIGGKMPSDDFYYSTKQ